MRSGVKVRERVKYVDGKVRPTALEKRILERREEEGAIQGRE